MSSKAQFAFALYLTRTEACTAIDALVRAGFPAERVSLRVPPEQESDELSFRRRMRIHFTAAGAVVGTLVGAAIYGLTGFNSLHVIESSMSGGPMGGILASVLAGGGLAGLIGSMDVFGQPKRVACQFQNRVQNFGYFLSVECQEETQKRNAEEILKLTGAEDVSCTSDLCPPCY